ncbi:MAG: AmmeMemoRadiSam system protein B [Candidatus Bathyarchaeota archaeon]|nr:AmmeMemoRadiSam system protein B [Candidatus Bathyarchaeota archaeon]
MTVRRPAVAGTFYPAQPERLKAMIVTCFQHKLGPGRLPAEPSDERNILAAICPHAGYVYSGAGAAHCYLALAEQKKPDTVIILGPNHTGWGTRISMMGEGAWETPLGSVELDSDLAKAIADNSDIIQYDETAFIREHNHEVHVPFLQYIYGDFKLVPISMGNQDLETSTILGEALHKATQGKNTVIIASTDLSHQEPQESTNRKDRMVIDAILEMDERKLQRVVQENRISMCGYGPVSVALVASKLAGAAGSELLSYYTSGDIIGDYGAVVGYAAAMVTK